MRNVNCAVLLALVGGVAMVAACGGDEPAESTGTGGTSGGSSGKGGTAGTAGSGTTTGSGGTSGGTTGSGGTGNSADGGAPEMGAGGGPADLECPATEPDQNSPCVPGEGYQSCGYGNTNCFCPFFGNDAETWQCFDS